MARGDQIYVMRPLAGFGGVYQHHGIDAGDETVVHYRKASDDDAMVSRTSFETFSWGNPVYTVHQPLAEAPDQVMERAISRLGERQYDLLFNNCEHFATWCKTGRSESAQLANFGLRLDQLSLPELRHFADRTTQSRSPAEALALCQKALGDISTAYRTTLTAQQTAQQETETWHRVAQQALHQGREDLARAALHRKVGAKKQAATLTTQLSDLVALQLNLERHQQLAEQRLAGA